MLCVFFFLFVPKPDLSVSFRTQPEKDAFLPPKSDESKTPQFTDVSFHPQGAPHAPPVYWWFNR